MQTVIQPPHAVRYGVFSMLASVILGALSVAVQNYAADDRRGLDPWLWVPFVLINSLFLYFLLLIWRRRNWARWVVLVWCVAGWCATVWFAYFMPYESALETALAFASLIADTLGCWFLFTQPSSSWFRTVGTAA